MCRIFLFTVHVYLSISVSEFRRKTTLVVLEIGDKRLVVLKIKVGGDLLDVFVGI